MLCCVQDKKETSLDFTADDKLDDSSQKAAALESLATAKIAEEQLETAKAKEQIKERDAQIRELQAQLAKISQAPLPGADAKKSTEHDDKDSKIHELENQLAQMGEQMRELQSTQTNLQASTAAKAAAQQEIAEKEMQIASLEAELNQRASPQALSSKDKQISFLESEISQLKSTLDEVTRTQGDSDLDQSKMLQLEADVEKQSSTIKMLEHQIQELSQEKLIRAQAEQISADRAEEIARLQGMLSSTKPTGLAEEIPAELSGFLAKVFAIFDQNCDNHIDEDELLEIGKFVFGSEKWDRALCHQMFQQVDQNNDGKISLQEFVSSGEAAYSFLEVFADQGFDATMKDEHIVSAMENAHLEIQRKTARHEARVHRMKEIFSKFDINGDGRLSHKELFGIGMALHADSSLGWSKDRNENLMKIIDKDGSGFVEIDEFLLYYKSVIYDVSDERFENGLLTFDKVAVVAHHESDAEFLQHAQGGKDVFRYSSEM